MFCVFFEFFIFCAGNVTAEGSAKEVTNPAATALHESTV